MSWAGSAFAAQQSFDAWTAGLRADALKNGISRGTVDTALSGLEPIPRVLELDRKQPEFTLTFQEYLQRVVSPQRVADGRERLAGNRAMLDPISARYGVPPEVMVALWGVESDFGRKPGTFSVVASLATLAWDGRRSSFFRKELINALKIVDGGHIALPEMIGSWAGAMGQNQFMPSSFVSYAADGDGDGRKDIWRNTTDVHASTANYLSRRGWRAGEPWGQAVQLPGGFREEGKVERSLAQWSNMGVTAADGRLLADNGLPASIVVADGAAFAVHRNYGVWLRWNNSKFFALAVGLLSDEIAGQR